MSITEHRTRETDASAPATGRVASNIEQGTVRRAGVPWILVALVSAVIVVPGIALGVATLLSHGQAAPAYSAPGHDSADAADRRTNAQLGSSPDSADSMDRRTSAALTSGVTGAGTLDSADSADSADRRNSLGHDVPDSADSADRRAAPATITSYSQH